MNYDTTDAINCLCEFFYKELGEQKFSFCEFEKFVLKEGHRVLAAAMSRALEQLDDALHTGKNEDLKIHEKKKRALATTLGTVNFKRRICRDSDNNSVCLLEEALDVPFKARISPYATRVLVSAGVQVSYQKAAGFIADTGGSYISKTAVMNQIKTTGAICKEEDEGIAYDLFVNGVLPESKENPETICIEADGTYVPLRTGEKVEIKAGVAYQGKQEKSRKERNSPVHFGCVGTTDEFWTQSVGRFGTMFDLGNVKKIYAGFDGEKKYQKLTDYLPINIEVEGQLDPFHLNRKVSSCFKKPCPESKEIISLLYLGRCEEAITQLEACRNMDLAKQNQMQEVAVYIRNNSEFIRCNPMSLGTIETDQEHIYKARFSGVPRVWSLEGVDSIARIRSRLASNQEVSYKSRNTSYSEKYQRLRQKKIEESFEKVPYVYQLTSGKGYNYPVQAHLNPSLKFGYERACINYLKETGGHNPT
jgi:hypothetical protein